MAYTYEQIREIFLKLPEDLREAYFSENISDKIIDIGKKHRLNVDKAGILGGETGLVLLGMEHPNKFIANLSAKLGVDKTAARDIAQDVNEQVFRPVRDSLRKIHGIADDSESPAKVSPSGNSQGETLVSQNYQGPTLMGQHREEILKEIEKDHTKDDVPDILKGSTNPFDVKMKEEVHQAPVEEKTYEEKKEDKPVSPPTPEKPKNKYTGFDPYREPVE